MADLLDRTNPQNPVRDRSMLFVPYCTGDVHSGSNVPQPAQRSGSAVGRAASCPLQPVVGFIYFIAPT